MEKLQLNFSYSFDKKIWNILGDMDYRLFIFELRDEESLTTSFSVYDCQTESFLCENIGFKENWWIGVTYGFRNVIVFHTYEPGDNPDKKKYFGYDIADNKIIWERENISWLRGVENVGFIHEKIHDEWIYLDIRNDKKLLETDITFNASKENNSILNPFHYRSGTEHFDTVKDFVKNNFEIDLLHGVDYFEKSDRVIISFYFESAKGKLVNRLLVLNHDKEPLLEEQLDDNLAGISDNTFFINDDKLIFVKEKTDFFVYDLN